MVENQEMDMIEKANLAAERLEKANEIHAELIKKQEAIEARRVLGGQTKAGEPQKPEISEEEKIKEGMKAYFKGGAIERAFK